MSNTETVYRKEPFTLQDKSDNTKRVEFDLSSVPSDTTNSMKFPKDGGSIGVPPGMVMWYCSNSPPTGWLECDGSAVSRTTYSDLFDVVGTTYGSGDGSTTFNLPELRGEFVRGWDNGRGQDSGRSFGTTQGDLFKSHTHIQERLYHTNYDRDSVNTNGGYRSSDISQGQFFPATQSTGGSETRPRNVALLPCIKV